MLSKVFSSSRLAQFTLTILSIICISSLITLTFFAGSCYHMRETQNYSLRPSSNTSSSNATQHNSHSHSIRNLVPDAELFDNMPKIVFSLTTSPKRLGNLKQTLESLINQELPPSKIQINLPRIFKRTGETYSDISNFEFLRHPLIYIHRSDDFGPATKLIPTVTTELNDSTLIIIVDDDTLYPPQLTKVYAKVSLMHPQSVIVGHCGEVYLASRPNGSTPRCRMFEAYAGVGFPRSLFQSDFMDYMNIALHNEYCFRSDDYVVSNYFASHSILGMKTAELGLLPGVVQMDIGKGKDALHNLAWIGHAHDRAYKNCELYLKTKGLAVLEVC